MASLTTRLSLRPLLLATSALLVATGISGGSPAAAGVTAAPPAAGVIQPVRTCSSLASVDLTGVDARVEKAAEVNRNGRNFCDVTGYMSPQTHFQVLLPLSTWRGNYLQQGCGGLCGSSVVNLDDPSRTSGYQVPFRPVSEGEMVVAADDEGHAGGGGLWGKDDPQLRVVFGYTSEHSMAVTAKPTPTHPPRRTSRGVLLIAPQSAAVRPAIAKNPNTIWTIIENARGPPFGTGCAVTGSTPSGRKPGRPPRVRTIARPSMSAGKIG